MRSRFAAIFLTLLAAPGVLLAASPANFSGDWDTVWEAGEKTTPLTIIQRGAEITGEYHLPGGKVSGRISGSVEGNKATGRWEQSDGAAGYFEFQLADAGSRFEGRWRNALSTNWEGPWNGKRTTRPRQGSPPLDPA